jgi:uncharacterized coiled-coil protein SlyX
MENNKIEEIRTRVLYKELKELRQYANHQNDIINKLNDVVENLNKKLESKDNTIQDLLLTLNK